MAAPSPDLFGKYDFIRRFLSDPCDAPWSAYALAMGGASVEAFVLLYSFDPSNFFYSALQSGTGISRRRSGRKGLPGTKAGRFRRRGAASKAAGYDPSTAAGHALGRMSPLARRPLPGVFGALWFAYNLFELANFFFFIADVIAQWLWRWMSLLWNSRYCQARDDAVILNSNPTYITAALFGEVTVIARTVLKQRGPITYHEGLLTVPTGWQGRLVWGANAIALNPEHDQILTVRLFKPTWIDPPQEAVYPISKEGETEVGTSFEITGGGNWIVTIELNVGFIALEETTYYVHVKEPEKGPAA